MIFLLSPSILYHHILTLAIIKKNTESELQTLWHPVYGENILFYVILLTYPTQVSNPFGDEMGPQM